MSTQCGGQPTRRVGALRDPGRIEESDRALVMLRTLMDISEAEAGIMKLAIGTVGLRVIAAETVDLYEHVAEDAGVSLSLALPLKSPETTNRAVS